MRSTHHRGEDENHVTIHILITFLFFLVISSHLFTQISPVCQSLVKFDRFKRLNRNETNTNHLKGAPFFPSIYLSNIYILTHLMQQVLKFNLCQLLIQIMIDIQQKMCISSLPSLVQLAFIKMDKCFKDNCHFLLGVI